MNKRIIVGIAIVILAIVGGGSYWLYNNQDIIPTQSITNTDEEKIITQTFEEGGGTVINEEGSITSFPAFTKKTKLNPGRYGVIVTTDKPTTYGVFKYPGPYGATPELVTGTSGVFDINMGDTRNEIAIRINSPVNGVDPISYRVIVTQQAVF